MTSPANTEWERVFEIFHGALERPESEREAFLRSSCADEDVLREVSELLAAHDGDDALLDRPLIVDTGEGSETAGLPELAVGAVLAGRFEVLRPLGSGGMASVWEAQDRELGTRVALKALRPAIAQDPDALARFRSEIALARQITHPNVCRVYDLFHHRTDDGDALQFVTMELLTGETLAQRLRRDGALSPAELLPIAEQVVAALAAAHHGGVVHRDLKPGNVMLVPTADGRSTRAVVADFGLAVSLGAADASRHTRAGQLIGTPAYMAPEQLTGGHVTAATDVYALGLLLYEALTGELPFADDSPFSGALRRLTTPSPPLRARLPELPRTWERTVARCLQQEPAGRFPSVAEVAASLHGAEPWGLIGGRHRWLAAAALPMAVLAVLAVAGYRRNREPPLPFATRDWVLIADFQNRTGEPVFDGTLEYALEQELSNSHFVNVVPRQRIDDALQLMERPLDTTIDRSTGREVCLRDGGIRALITGRVEKLDTTYVLSAELVNPESGVTVASFSDEAAGHERVASAVRLLANRVRSALGEGLTSIEGTGRRLARVTTPSLRALYLFTQADAVIARSPQGNVTAEQLLRDAVVEDPQFASAYMHLAFALRNQERPPAEYLPYARRALELSTRCSERERYFILGSFHSMMRDDQDAVAAYRALVQLYPKDYWGNNNLAVSLERLGRTREAVPYRVKMAELQPHDFAKNAAAGWALVADARDPEAARPFFERARRLISPRALQQSAGLAARLELYPAARSWVRGRPREALDQVDEVARLRLPAIEPPVRDEYAWQVGGGYLTLGRLDAATEAYRSVSDRDGAAQGLALVAWARGDDRAVAQALHHPAASLFNVMVLARTGHPEQAEEALPPPDGSSAQRPGMSKLRQAALGVLWLARGRGSEAVDVLARAVPVLRERDSSYYFMAANALADADEAQGQPRAALTVLEEAARERPHISEAFIGFFWTRTAAHRARLLRQLGRTREADAVDAQLRALLAFADPDVVLLHGGVLPGRRTAAAEALPSS